MINKRKKISASSSSVENDDDFVLVSTPDNVVDI